MEARKGIKLHQSENSVDNGKSSFSDEINIVVFKDTSRQNLPKRTLQCRFSSNKVEPPKLNKKLKNGNGSSPRDKGTRQLFPCNQCDYEGTKSNLSVHRLRTHNKGYKCSKCEYQSVTEGGVERHERIFHSTEDVRAYACGVCSYRGVTRKQLHEHTKYQHREGVAKHACPACQKMFKTLVQLKHHIISHSLERLYSCRGCPYTAKHRQSLRLHIRHCHPESEVHTLFRGPTDSDFEALIRSAASVGPNPPWASGEGLKVGFSASSENDSKTGEEDQRPTTSLLGGGGVDNLLIFPLGSVTPLCKGEGANGMVAKSSADGSPNNSLCDASFNQILVHLLGTK